MTIDEAIKQMDIVYRGFYPQLMCSDVCKIFLMIMDSHGIEGRYVALTRDTTPIQGHSVCEAKIDGKWILFDVAFNWCPRCSAADADPRGHPCPKERPEYLDEFKELYNRREYVTYR